MKSRIPSAIKILLCALLLLTLAAQAAFAASKEIRVYFNGTPLQFDQAKPVVKNNTTLVPFRKLFETLGFEVKWTTSGGVGQAIGTKKGLEIQLTLGKTTAVVNGKQVKLSVPAQNISGSTMIPLRFVSENSGYPVSYTENGSLLTIQIGSGSSTGTGTGSGSGSGSGSGAEPYIVKGQVVDSAGKPVPGVEIFADNELLYNSNLITYTDAKGNYEIELPRLASTWHMGGHHTIQKDGQSVNMSLKPTNEQSFAGNTGAVRNFILDETQATGELYLYMDINSFMNGYVETNVQLTLTPVSGGKAIIGKGDNFPGGFGMNNVLVGRYMATAVYAPPGEKPQPMEIRVRNKGAYAESVEIGFSPLTPTLYQAEIEVRMPGDGSANES